MLSRSQVITIKRAQAQAGIGDDEYREALVRLTGCRSSKDADLGDEHFDVVLSYFEAIFWRGVDAGALQVSFKADAPFRQRGYWAGKNRSGRTSRDRYTAAQIAEEIIDLECLLAALGLPASYSEAIRRRVCGEDISVASLARYRSALKRTLRAKQGTEMGVA